MKRLIILLLAIMTLSSCSTSKGVRTGGLLYKGQVVKSNGERKTKVFIFGRDQCVRKNRRMVRKRARMRSYDRNPNYGITTGSHARQRH